MFFFRLFGASDREAKLAALNRAQAVIEFAMDGTVIEANENFLKAMGYQRDEVIGKHHSLFVDPTERDSAAYREFWSALNRGEFSSAEYRRVAKGGREVWIQASYNPIFDMSGKPFKVVKYASDTTAQVKARLKAERARDEIAEGLSGIDLAISDASEQSAAASEVSDRTSSIVQAVATGAEQFNASVNEIAESMVKSKAESDAAYESVQEADAATQRLAAVAQEMNGIVGVIQDIAGRINLLALNASIESSRAGEAGRGFAVVAHEVKDLATQAAGATEKIASEIAGMQDVSGAVVEGLAAIKTSITSVRDYVVATSSAVSEQSVVAQEMSANMQSASHSVEAISQNVRSIAEATRNADASTKRVRTAAESVS